MRLSFKTSWVAVGKKVRTSAYGIVYFTRTEWEGSPFLILFFDFLTFEMQCQFTEISLTKYYYTEIKGSIQSDNSWFRIIYLVDEK